MARYVGIDIGATQVKVAVLRGNPRKWVVDALFAVDRLASELLVDDRPAPLPTLTEAIAEEWDRIRREDLIAFYKRYFFPANIMFAVSGDFSAPEMKAEIEKLFSGWTYRQPPPPPFLEVTAKPAPGIYLAAKDDVTQTFFSIGHLGGVLKDKDYPALEVMGDILGGGFPSRLFQRIRVLQHNSKHFHVHLGDRYEFPVDIHSNEHFPVAVAVPDLPHRSVFRPNPAEQLRLRDG